MTVLCAHQLAVHHADKAILQDISLATRSGQFIGVIGPNGAGKSTLLSVLAGLRQPRFGQVTWDGEPLARMTMRELASRRAYLPQNPRSEWPVSVEQLVMLGLTPLLPAYGKAPDQLVARVAKTLAQVNLWDKREQDVNTLSGGELSRTMLARALVGEPEVLLVDEPIAGLDPAHALAAVKLLHARAMQGSLVMASMHDLTLAARYASHCALLNRGTLIAYGPTAEVMTDARLSEVFGIATSVTDAATPDAQVNFGT